MVVAILAWLGRDADPGEFAATALAHGLTLVTRKVKDLPFPPTGALPFTSSLDNPTSPLFINLRPFPARSARAANHRNATQIGGSNARRDQAWQPAPLRPLWTAEFGFAIE